MEKRLTHKDGQSWSHGGMAGEGRSPPPGAVRLGISGSSVTRKEKAQFKQHNLNNSGSSVTRKEKAQFKQLWFLCYTEGKGTI